MDTAQLLTIAPQTGDKSFQVKGGARYSYIYRAIDAELAEAYGCPGANAVLVGSHGHMVGTATPVTGKAVRVPGWPGWMLGILTVFSYGDDETLKGWVEA